MFNFCIDPLHMIAQSGKTAIPKAKRRQIIGRLAVRKNMRVTSVYLQTLSIIQGRLLISEDPLHNAECTSEQVLLFPSCWESNLLCTILAPKMADRIGACKCAARYALGLYHLLDSMYAIIVRLTQFTRAKFHKALSTKKVISTEKYC